MPRRKGDEVKRYIYKIEGKYYQFDNVKYVENCNKLMSYLSRKKNAKVGIKSLHELIFGEFQKDSYELISFETLNNWRNNNSTPKDISRIENLVKAMNSLGDGKFIFDKFDLLYEIPEYDGEIDIELPEKPKWKYTIDWTNSHSAIRSVYLLIRCYIEEFKRTVGFEDCYKKNHPNCPGITDIEDAIYDCMLDMPSETFDAILSFCRGYLKDMNYFDEGYDLIWYRDTLSSGFPSYSNYEENKIMEEDMKAANEFPGGPEAYYKEMEAKAMNMVLEDTFQMINEYYGGDKEAYYLDLHNGGITIKTEDDTTEYDEEDEYSMSISEKIGYVNYIADKAYAMLREILVEN